jgi:hypothetical protein
MSHVLAAANVENVDGVATLRGLEGIFKNIISSLLFIAGIALFIMLVVGGIKFITSGGDPKGLEAAKKTLTYAIGGIVLVAISYLIIFFIEHFTGATVTEFAIFRGPQVP